MARRGPTPKRMDRVELDSGAWATPSRETEGGILVLRNRRRDPCSERVAIELERHRTPAELAAISADQAEALAGVIIDAVIDSSASRASSASGRLRSPRRSCAGSRARTQDERVVHDAAPHDETIAWSRRRSIAAVYYCRSRCGLRSENVRAAHRRVALSPVRFTRGLWRAQRRTRKASRSTRGWPAVPITTRRSTWAAGWDQLFEKTIFGGWLTAEKSDTVPAYAPSR